jgi:hypothetical protein
MLSVREWETADSIIRKHIMLTRKTRLIKSMEKYPFVDFAYDVNLKLSIQDHFPHMNFLRHFLANYNKPIGQDDGFSLLSFSHKCALSVVGCSNAEQGTAIGLVRLLARFSLQTIVEFLHLIVELLDLGW